MKSGRPIIVGLLWHSLSSGNLGVGALTISNMAILNKCAKALGVPIHFHVIGWREANEPYISGPNVTFLSMRSWTFFAPRGGLYSAIRECDLICDIGAGDSFADIYGPKRFAWLCLSKLIVLLGRRPLILSPQTIGPFQHWWSSLIANGLMRHCSAIAVRDDISLELLAPLSAQIKVAGATDVAFRLPGRPVQLPRTRRWRIGINVSGLLFHGGYDRQNMFKLVADYPQLIRAILRYFTSQENCEIHLISHVHSLTNHTGTETPRLEDDYAVSQLLAGEFPRTILAPRFDSPSTAKSYIAAMDFFCGSRMHACIAAFSSGVPVVPIAYSRKFNGLFQSLGYSHIADSTKETIHQILVKVKKGFEEREMLRASIEAGNQRAREKLTLYEDLLTNCFLDISKKKM